ncbi:MAG: hypothetical protein IJX01_08555 [Oscillospiraceae bacterium]|nr:hypothetical protein [Oscillospiraceae bacterium]
MMKKIFSLLLVFIAVSIMGCSANDPHAQDSSAPNNYNSTTASTVQSPTHNTLGSDKTPANTYSIKKIDLLQREYTLKNSKKVYGQNFKVLSTLTDGDSIHFISALIDDVEHSNTQADNWPKYNPARANEYAIKIFFDDGSIIVINLHFTEQSNISYIAIANSKEDIEYNTFVTSTGADELFTKHTIEKAKGDRLIRLFKENN